MPAHLVQKPPPFSLYLRLPGETQRGSQGPTLFLGLLRGGQVPL